MIDWFLNALAERLGVEPARVGEAIVPSIRFEQPWPQWLTLVVLFGSIALIVWLYRHEGTVSPVYKTALAAIRISLVLIALFMLAEAVLSVERTGLPYFVVMVDDSASQQVADNYENAKTKAAVAELAKSSGITAPEVTRWAVAEGFLQQDKAKILRELQKQNKVRLYTTSTGPRLLAEIDKPEQIGPVLEEIKKHEPNGGQTRLGDSVEQVLTELRGAPPSAILILTDGQTTEGEPLDKSAELAARKGVPIYPVGLGSPEPPRDLELSELLVDDVVFVDDLVRFQAKLTSKGFEGQEIVVPPPQAHRRGDLHPRNRSPPSRTPS